MNTENSAPFTLRALYGLEPPRALVAARTALVLVDCQQEFLDGRLRVEGGPAAVARAVQLRAWARAHGITVVAVRHVAARADSPLFAPGAPGTAFVPALEPEAGDVLVVKHQAGAFSRTDLDARLRALGIDTLVVAGIMTHLAVDTTARDATVLGYQVVVAGDACATRALPGAPALSAQEVHRAALASLADRFADVMETEAITRLPVIG